MENILRGIHIDILFWCVVPVLFTLLVLVTVVRVKLKKPLPGAKKDGEDRRDHGG
jgi:hypothetical protein